MEKDFDGWNEEKKKLEKIEPDTLPFHEREIWWCSIGINLGDEQDGKNELFERPVLILKKFNNKIAWVLPMTTRQKRGIYYYQLEHEGRIFSVILSQLRLLSIKRFRRYIRKISPHQFSLIQNKLADFIKKK
ncbi:MAG: type II toxin-antitoxin system PemK/MazF family toxin [Candidatus Vogelbacteria bacterium]|nr:type II toxin-antitoxin system PemK/MazF family toxin [Candidatus Vogelbacteria bacterium]